MQGRIWQSAALPSVAKRSDMDRLDKIEWADAAPNGLMLQCKASFLGLVMSNLGVLPSFHGGVAKPGLSRLWMLLQAGPSRQELCLKLHDCTFASLRFLPADWSFMINCQAEAYSQVALLRGLE